LQEAKSSRLWWAPVDRPFPLERIDIADNTLDLAIYEGERGWPSRSTSDPSRSSRA